MNEEEILQRLEMLEKTVMACMEKIDSVDNLLVNEIINPIADAYSQRENDYNYEQFKNKYGERLDPYSKTLSALETEDKDVTRTAYDTYNSYDDETKAKFSEEQYVDMLVTELDKYISKVKEVLGLPSNAEVEIKSDGEGNVELAVEGEEVAVAEEEPKPVEETEEEVETETEVEDTEKEKPEETSKNENDEFYKELLRDRAKYMRR